jgi:HD-GYP domain-containing protein (c-di-GMP phosphodiesterase class II)
LRGPKAPKFIEQIQALFETLFDLAKHHPDTALFSLFRISFLEMRYYSSTHSMRVCVMCLIAAREVLEWTEDHQRTLGLAALTMNIGMTRLQDQMAN